MTSRPRGKIWITRAQPGAEATAGRVRAMGREAFVAPLLAVRAISGARVELDGVAALAFTSANGVRSFAEACAERDLPVFAVGAATAGVASAAGFRDVVSADGDVAALAEAIAGRAAGLGGAVLHPGAAERAGDLATSLAERGVEVRFLTLYETVPTELTAGQLEALAGLDAVLLHSPKAARALAAVLSAHPVPGLRALALSEAVLRPLAGTPLAAKVFAALPIEAFLLNLIEPSP